jgi:DhnA family fructose-bisphosphate aldolase class Ia
VGKYEIGTYEFKLQDFFPMSVFDQITEARVRQPHVVEQEARMRRRRRELTTDGKLTILAADHPGRMVTSSGDDPIAMADRQQYLGRVLRVISSPSVDGLMGTTDIIEDVLIVNHLMKEAGGPSFLDNRILIGSMNRSGLAGSSWEMDDRFTCFTPESISALNMDAAKLMFRLCLDDPASNDTLDATANAIMGCNNLGIPVFVECLPVEKVEGKYKIKRTYAELMKVIGVACALGDSSRYMWLKIPYCDGYEKVARATTLPMLMLGGESRGDPTGTIEEFAKGIKAGGTIRGALVGRNVTFPGKDDPLAVALAINGIVHEALSAGQAIDRLMASRDQNSDALTKWLA